jgi:GH15 family glucan-1,4-alpha-glucosidase
VAADLADLNHDASIATYLREIADVWHDSIDDWMYVSGTDWCEKFKVEGYCIRIASREIGVGMPHSQRNVHVKNVPASAEILPVDHW